MKKNRKPNRIPAQRVRISSDRFFAFNHALRTAYHALFALVLFAAICAPALAQDTVPPPPPLSRTVKVMTINLRQFQDWWEDRFPLIADEIVRLNPDIIGMQEMQIGINQSAMLEKLINEKSGGQLKYYVYEHLKTGSEMIEGEGIAIFSKFPFEKKTFANLDYGRLVLATRIDLGEGLKIDFFDTHLHHKGGDDVRFGQAKKIVDLVQKLDAANVTFLTGDMNSEETSNTIKYFLDNSFVDTYKKFHGDKTYPDGNTSSVILTKQNIPQKQNERIDYVFLKTPPGRQDMARILDSVVCFKNKNAEGLYPSDHLGVMTTVEIFY